MTDEVLFSVNLESPIAVYVQIENQVQFAISSGRLAPGDTLPSVREMSTLLDVNPNTVTKAYRDLELLQMVHTRRGVGVTVADKAPKVAKEKTRTMVQEHLMDAVAECSAAGLTAEDIRGLVTQTIESGLQPYEIRKGRH